MAAAAIPLLVAGSMVGSLGMAESASAAGRALPASLASSIDAAPALSAGTSGVVTLDAPGQVASFGDAPAEGQPSDLAGAPATASDVVGIARTPTGHGYWVATASGGVFSYGDAAFHGSLGSQVLNRPIVGIAATPDGGGYWLVAADGGVFSFGDAQFHGSLGGVALNSPVVGIGSTPTGHGYWLVASDGGVFSFGDAGYHGGLGGVALAAPVVGIAATGTGDGYWLAAKDGGVFSFGDAGFHGSLPSMGLRGTISSVAPSPTGDGYWLAAADGGVYSFGDALYHGSVAASSSQVAGLASTPDGQGYWEVTGNEPPADPPAAAAAVATSADGAPAGYRSLGTFEITCYDLTGATASGAPAGPGEVAVDPGLIPLGATLWIQGVGTVRAEDTGGAIIGHHIDLWLPAGACYQWGVQYRGVAEA